ncbi:YbaB/EbfC family nucleoid-associated protein [Actinoplanes teichomyceticus]|nr:YbaB/EbfC family nucleoid-associated protein [Actinoplanes teichomyceticus]
MNSLSGVGLSDDRLVRVGVDGSGTPQTVVIEPEAMQLSCQQLSASVLTAVTAALDDVRGQVAALMESELMVQPDDFGSASASPEAAVWRLSRQAEQTMGDFDAVRRHLFDRLPE